VIAATANSGMGALYVPGSDKGKGWKETRVKPELFTDKEGVGKVAMAFNKEANELAKVAATGDAAALKVQFGKVGETCKGCHDKFRQED
jgi:cytochrome c556